MRSWPERVFCDTSFFFACLEARDLNHEKAVSWLRESKAANTTFWTTWEIISETVTLLRIKSDYNKAAAFVKEVVPTLQVISLDDSVRQEALTIFLRFSRDKKLSFCDCLSYVVTTSILDLAPTATFDKHFKMLGLPILR